MEKSIQATTKVKRPVLLRVIFILNLLLIIACFSIYNFITSDPTLQSKLGIDPNLILVNGGIYILTFLVMEVAGYKRMQWLMLATFAVDIIVSFVIVIAPIGWVVGAASIALTFTKPVRNYFAS